MKMQDVNNVIVKYDKAGTGNTKGGQLSYS
jgi:hypothetical protein